MGAGFGKGLLRFGQGVLGHAGEILTGGVGGALTGGPAGAVMGVMGGLLPGIAAGIGNLTDHAADPRGPQNVGEAIQSVVSPGLGLAGAAVRGGMLADGGQRAGEVIGNFANGLAGGMTIRGAASSAGVSGHLAAMAEGARQGVINKASGVMGVNPTMATVMGNPTARVAVGRAGRSTVHRDGISRRLVNKYSSATSMAVLGGSGRGMLGKRDPAARPERNVGQGTPASQAGPAPQVPVPVGAAGGAPSQTREPVGGSDVSIHNPGAGASGMIYG